MPSKRPQGLSKAAKNKKQKVLSNDDSTPDKDQTPDLTIALEDEVDPDDELAQLYGLFNTYQESLSDSPKLLYGLIHECDRLLRNSTEKLPSRFHDIYAKSLLDLAKFFEEDEEGTDLKKKKDKKTKSKTGESSQDFIVASIERATTGIEESPENAVNLLFTRSRAKIALADDRLKSVSPFERYNGAVETLPTLEDAIEDFERAEKLLLASGKGYIDFTREQLSTIEDLLQIADGFAALEQDNFDGEDENDNEQPYGALHGKQEKYLEWSKIRYQKILESSADRKGKNKDHNGLGLSVLQWANRGMGQYYLALAAPLLAKVEVGDEDEDEDEDKDEVEDEDEDDDEDGDEGEESELSPEELEKVKSLVNEAVQYLLKSESDDAPETYSIVAEALISLANLNEVESDEQKRLYAEAVLRLKKSQRLGYGNYQELIADLQE